MTLDELAVAIRNVSPRQEVQRLAEMLIQWKGDDSSVDDLRDRVEDYIENTWTKSDAVRQQVYDLWAQFAADPIAWIHGMTMNERVYCFSLVEPYDAARTKAKKKPFYAKLLAKP
jgi:uncharacterized protein YbdZ (MbtH family)